MNPFSVRRVSFPWSKITLTFILVISIWSASNVMWGKHAGNIIKADGKGYYAHLPALFIYGDLNFGFFDSIESKYPNEHLYYDYRKYSHGRTYNKYFAGTAFCIMPFFLLGHGATLLANRSADGYSSWYQISVSWAAIVYALLTLWLFIRILRRWQISDGVIAYSILCLFFGTNWYYYVLAEPSMSHNYSILLITALFWNAMKWSENGSRLRLLYMFGLLGLITWVRPLNLVSALLIPLAFPDMRSFAKRLQESASDPRIWLMILLIPAVVFMQVVLYRIQTGSFLIYSYEEEGFNFFKPQIMNILFSYKKGLFLYTPLLLIALLFSGITYRKNRYRTLGLLAFFTLLTYLLSSWWNWYYGGSFSSRVYLEYYLIFLIPLALGLQAISKRNNAWPVYLLLGLLILLCQFQTLQYRYMVIHWDSMTREKYWEVFFNTDFLTR